MSNQDIFQSRASNSGPSNIVHTKAQPARHTSCLQRLQSSLHEHRPKLDLWVFFLFFFKLRTEVKNSVNTSIRSYGLCLFKSTPIKCFANFEMALFMLDDMVRWYTRHFFDYSKEKELERKRADQRGVGGNKTQTMRAGSAAVCLCLQLSSRLSLECGSEYKKKQVFYI